MISVARPVACYRILTVSVALAAALFLFMTLPREAHATVMHIVNGGELTGAKGVVIDGSEYDVSFVDGACSDVFNGCDDGSDFTFSTWDAARAAGLALLNQVLIDNVTIDGTTYDFDSYPMLTAGCGLLSDCYIFIPYATYKDPSQPPLRQIQLDVQSVTNGIDSDVVIANASYGELDLGNIFAVFQPHQVDNGGYTSVPVPGTLSLFGVGLAGLVVVRRMRHPRARQCRS